MYFQAVPCRFPSIAHNTNLRFLSLAMYIPRRRAQLWVYQSLTDLLSKIESSHLRNVFIWYHLVPVDLQLHPLLDTDIQDSGGHVNTAEAVNAVHDILRRPVYATLPESAVRIHLQCVHSRDSTYASSVELNMALSEMLKDSMSVLLAPWLARNVVWIFFPDGS